MLLFGEFDGQKATIGAIPRPLRYRALRLSGAPSLRASRCASPSHVSSFFRVTVGTIELDGMDYWLLDSAGLIKEMTVLWRPLPGAIAVRDRLGE
jgi:hypothetical protein